MASSTSTKEHVLPKLPSSDATVNVSIIDTGSNIICPSAAFMEPVYFGLEAIVVPVLSFMVRNTTSNRTVLFDLGVRKDWENLPAPLLARLKAAGFFIETENDVREILEKHGQDTAAIEAIIWSHGHFDHTGDPSTFESSTELIIGPGSKSRLTPGYPTDENSGVLESDFASRNVREITSHEFDLTIGRMPAMDYFGDQSFYLLDAPGHFQGHMCALARVTSEPDSFILLGADCVHHMGQLRPNKWTPIVEDISPNPLQDSGMCPADVANTLCVEKGRGSPFFEPTAKGAHADAAIAKETIDKVQELDALENVWVAIAHDPAILEVADVYPQKANDFMQQGWKQKTQWSFLNDLVPGVDAARGQSLHRA